MSLVFQEVDSNRRRRRVIQFSIIVILSFGGLFFRLASLQLSHGDELKKRAIQNFVRRKQIPAKRGSILDRNLTPLAVHKPTYLLYFLPSQITNIEATVDAVRDAIQLSEVESINLKDEIQSRKKRRSRARIKLDRVLDRGGVARIEALGSVYPGLSVQTKYKREYPAKQIGAHLVGYLGLVSAKELAADEDERLTAASRVGRFGLEKRYESVLSGRPGFQQFAVDVY